MSARLMKVSACCLAGLIVFAGNSIETQAKMAGLSGAGFAIALDEGYVTKSTTETAIATSVAPEIIASEYTDIAIAQVTNYVNIRSTASEDGEVLGKLYNNSAATVLATEGDWYQIKSGTVTGYVKSEFVVTGEAAATLAEEVGHRIGTVATETLYVRTAPNTEATIWTMVPMGEQVEVVSEPENGWAKVTIDAEEVDLYVSAEFLNITTEFVEAESVEEENARLAAEAARKAEAEAAAKKADEAKKTSDSTTSETSSAAPAVTAPVSGSRASIISYALQFVGNSYVAGGTSLTNGTDCSGFTSSVFRDCGVSIPRDSRSQAASGAEIDISAIQPGDLLFYSNGSTINHVALYIGNGQVVHASNPRTGIVVSSYNYRTPCKAVTYLN